MELPRGHLLTAQNWSASWLCWSLLSHATHSETAAGAGEGGPGRLGPQPSGLVARNGQMGASGEAQRERAEGSAPTCRKARPPGSRPQPGPTRDPHTGGGAETRLPQYKKEFPNL